MRYGQGRGVPRKSARGSRMGGKGGRGGAYQAGIDAALRAVAAQLKGRGLAAKGRKGSTGSRGRTYQAGLGFDDAFEDRDYQDTGRGPLRIGHRM